VAVRLAHEVAPIFVAGDDSHHSVVATIDGRPGCPDVATLLGLSAETARIPLVIERAGDGECTTDDGLQCYTGTATAGAFGTTDALDMLAFLYDERMFRSMLYPRRSAESMEHATFDRGKAFAVYTNLISGGVLHPRLQDRATFERFVAKFPELANLVVDGKVQVAEYTLKHVTSAEATNSAAHQALHTDPPSNCARTVVVYGVTLSGADEAVFCARHAVGIIASKKNVENHAISTPEGNVQTRAWNMSIGADVCDRVDVAGFVSPSGRFEAGGIVAPGALVRVVPSPNAPADATGKCPICTAVAAWASGVLSLPLPPSLPLPLSAFSFPLSI
jgi:hypothetical protein